MAFKMGLKKEELTGPPPVPNGIYELRVDNFRPKISKNGESLNYNAEFSVTGNPEFDNRKIFHPLNTSFGVAIRDFVHATGNDMEKATIDGEEVMILPGIFEDADKNPDDPSKWGKYKGPLTNATFKAEVVQTEYQGKLKNEIRCFFCAFPGCATMYPDMKHSTKLIKD